MDTPNAVWIAALETRSTSSLALGATPELAIVALVEAWVERFAPIEKVDPALIWELREDVVLSEGRLGRGYVRGAGDAAWFETLMGGDDERLADTWTSLAARFGIEPAASVSPSP